jgi:hypothetical protein
MTFEHDPLDELPFTRDHAATLRSTAEQVTALTSRVDELESQWLEMPTRSAALDDEIEGVATNLRSVLARLDRPKPIPEEAVIDLDAPTPSRWTGPAGRRSTGWQPVEPSDRD